MNKILIHYLVWEHFSVWKSDGLSSAGFKKQIAQTQATSPHHQITASVSVLIERPLVAEITYSAFEQDSEAECWNNVVK